MSDSLPICLRRPQTQWRRETGLKHAFRVYIHLKLVAKDFRICISSRGVSLSPQLGTRSRVTGATFCLHDKIIKICFNEFGSRPGGRDAPLGFRFAGL